MRLNIIEAAKTRIESKRALLDVVRRELEEVKAAELISNDNKAKAENLAEKPAFRLYQAQVSGLLDKAEVSTILVEGFGAKPKSDGKPGKTPAGQGEQIRKRIVRAIQARDYLSGSIDCPAWAEGVSPDEIELTLLEMERDDDPISIFTAYDRFGDMKEKGGTVRLPFDVKKLLQIAEALNDGAALEKIASSPSLVHAYEEIGTALLALADMAGQSDNRRAA